MDNKKSTYNASAQKKYNEKNTIYSIKYLYSENEKVLEIEKAIKESGLSKSQWIKKAIDYYLSK